MKIYPLHPLAEEETGDGEDCAVVRMVGYDPSNGDEVEPEDLCKNYSSKEAAAAAREKK
jgi:hypothetical protein